MVTCLLCLHCLEKCNTYVIIIRHVYRDARVLHGQLAMYVLIHHCLFYVMLILYKDTNEVL